MKRNLRIAVVHDWLYVYGGAERVLAAILRCCPNADVYTLFDVLTPEQRSLIGFTNSTTSFLQHMPGIKKRHRLYLPLMPLAIEQFDLSKYDVIVSSSYAVAKGVLTGPDQLHLAYVHSPMRYAWDLQNQNLQEAGLESGIKGLLARLLMHHMRVWDTRTANGPNHYLANSQFVARRILKTYGRAAQVIYPPVEISSTLRRATKQRYFMTASRLVPYKNIKHIIEAFKNFPDQQLIVAGDGPEREKLESIAGHNVIFKGFVPDAELRSLMAEAQAFIFAAEEDFGIIPIEAQAEGTPVIALGRGGSLETIVTYGPKPTGLFFQRADAAHISSAIEEFLATAGRYSPEACIDNARRFSTDRFIEKFRLMLESQIAQHYERLQIGRTLEGPKLVPPSLIEDELSGFGTAPEPIVLSQHSA